MLAQQMRWPSERLPSRPPLADSALERQMDIVVVLHVLESTDALAADGACALLCVRESARDVRSLDVRDLTLEGPVWFLCCRAVAQRGLDMRGGRLPTMLGARVTWRSDPNQRLGPR